MAREGSARGLDREKKRKISEHGAILTGSLLEEREERNRVGADLVFD
jgi:hypothetical protein